LTRLASLGSGSRGNGTLIELGDTLFLVDCGFTLRQAEDRMRRLGVAPGDLAAILVTHEHTDHIGGVAALAHRYRIPVYGSYGTLRGAGGRVEGRIFDSHCGFRIAGVDIRPVIVPHDAREPTQFVFSCDGAKLGVVSDLGHVTPYVIEQFSGCAGLMMESNYDPELLRTGRYPEPVKRRIDSDLGHLSNGQAAEFLEAVAHPALRVVVGHVSEQNNHPELLEAAFEAHREQVAELHFATQNDGIGWINLGSE
jgi:phosphoribosyl 1,2-cyclic phosphodiesterase